MTKTRSMTMSDLEYAPEGYRFARVSTPSVFCEYTFDDGLSQ
jgi:hypothetical protein